MVIPEDVARFRDEYRKHEIPRWYLGWVHFATTSLGSLAVIGWSLSGVQALRGLELLTIPVTFLFANYVEWRGHRGPMHRPVTGLGLIFDRHTLKHHHFYTHQAMAYEETRDFQIQLFPVLLIGFFLGLHLVPIALLLRWLVGANVARLFVATGVGYFLTYEWLHFAYHLPEESWVGRLPFLSTLRAHHTRHHDPAVMSRWNFNITFPICDGLFGTRWRPER